MTGGARVERDSGAVNPVPRSATGLARRPRARTPRPRTILTPPPSHTRPYHPRQVCPKLTVPVKVPNPARDGVGPKHRDKSQKDYDP